MTTLRIEKLGRRSRLSMLDNPNEDDKKLFENLAWLLNHEISEGCVESFTCKNCDLRRILKIYKKNNINLYKFIKANDSLIHKNKPLQLESCSIGYYQDHSEEWSRCKPRLENYFNNQHKLERKKYETI